MTKLFAIAFTCVYLTLTVGVVHATHYCMGRVDSSAFFSFESRKCACELFASRSDKSCCDDEISLIKIEDDQSVSAPLTVVPEFFYMGELTFSVLAEKPAQSGISFLITHDKPPGDQVPLFVQHCSLILYSDSEFA
jgi:hypothetical protein